MRPIRCDYEMTKTRSSGQRRAKYSIVILVSTVQVSPQMSTFVNTYIGNSGVCFGNTLNKIIRIDYECEGGRIPRIAVCNHKAADRTQKRFCILHVPYHKIRKTFSKIYHRHSDLQLASG